MILVKEMYVEGKRRRGRPKTRWLNMIESEIKRAGISVHNAGDRVK